MTVDPTQISLSSSQQMRLALLADASGKDWSEIVDDLLNATPASSLVPANAAPNGRSLQERTLLEVLSERGILGCFDGPTDLSTNPKHMEGFGEPRKSKCAD
jgi:hypothetical protein